MKKVLLRAPILTQSGYGHHARTVLRALRTREDLFDVYLHAINWGTTSWMWEDTDERRWIDSKLEKTMNYVNSGGTFDMSIQVTIPNEWEKIAPINIGITAGIETTKVSPQWIEKSTVVDKIITISNHSKMTYENTSYQVKDDNTGQDFTIKCLTPVDYVSYPVLAHEEEDLPLEISTDFNFLSVVQISPRKNTEKLIKCFVEKFKEDENVGLVLKVNTSKNSKLDRSNTLSRLRGLLNQYNDRKCKIYLLHGYLTDGQMSSLYNNPKIKAFVTATRGEGFGLPLFESAYYGLPVIAPDWSGHVDFLYMPKKVKRNKKTKEVMRGMFAKVGYTLQPVVPEAVWEGVIQKDSLWAEVNESSLKSNLSEVYKDHGRFAKQAKDLQKWVVKNFNKEKQYKEYVDSIMSTPGLTQSNEIENMYNMINL